ncbi:contractile injection system tape measure protein [Tenacibaculum halocynthiae]|uniref:contractile injection system tape measure protein n=1 Tax=Tenacibaculum halocynthiae TaxID=1254437 RepID=UPI003D65DF54
MIAKTEHSIEKVFVEVNTKSKKVANEYKNSMEAFLQEEVFPLINEYFNSLEVESNSEMIIQQISKLAIEVNVSKRNKSLSFKNTKQQIRQQFLEKLEVVLNKPEMNELEINSVTVSKSKVNTFFYFLENGTFPWWNNNKEDFFSKKILFQITENENFQIKFLKAIQNEKVKKRLVNQFFDNELCLLFLGILNKPKGLNEVLSFISKAKKIPEEKRKSIWFYVVEAVLVKDFLKVVKAIEKNDIQLKDKKQLNKIGVELNEKHTELQGGFNITRDDLGKKSNLNYVLEFFYAALPELKENKESEKEDFVNSSRDKLNEKNIKEQIFKKGKEAIKINDVEKEKDFFLKNKEKSLFQEKGNFLPEKSEELVLKTKINKENLKLEGFQKIKESTKEEFNRVNDDSKTEEINRSANRKPREESEVLSKGGINKELLFEKENVKIKKENKVDVVDQKTNTVTNKLNVDKSSEKKIAKTHKKEQKEKLKNKTENRKENESSKTVKKVENKIEKREDEILENRKRIIHDRLYSNNFKKTERKFELDVNKSVKKNEESELIVQERINIQESFDELNIQIVKNETGVANQAKSYFVENAGLILIHPFLKQFFNSCNFLNAENKIIKPIQAVHLLHYVATKKERQVESNLVFEKFLCNVPINHSIPRNIKLSEELKEKAEELMKAVTQNWEVLKKSSPDLIRNEFIQRVGKLDLTKDNPNITIERKVHDILLDKLPWNYSMCKLPWMKGVIFTNW